nr:gliding motility-associated C-terminal domain-containing protein [Spirosomataceae bacterium]
EYKLNGKIGGVAQSATWSTNGTGKFSNALALGAIYYPSLEDLIKGEIILTLTTNDPDGNGPCAAGQDQMKLVFEGIKFRPQIIVNGVMKTDTVSQTINICQGDTVKLKASEGAEYQIKWIKDGKILFPASDGIRSWHVTEPGTYSYQLVDSKRCCSYNSAFITVNVSTTSEPLTTNLRNTCPNTTVNLLDGINSSNASVQFRTGNTSTSPIVATPSAVGAGMYYAFNKVGSCFSAPSPIEVKIFNCASDTVKPDVRITKMVDKAAAGINDVLNYKIVVKNLGKGTATNIDICDKLPESELVSAGGMNIVNGILKTRITTLAANDSVVYNVSTRAKKVGTLTNLVEISYMDQTDPNTANNVATASTVVSENGAPNPGIGVALAVTGINKKDGDPVNYDVTYKVTVKNTGNVALTNVQVCDSITKAFVAPTTFTVVGITIPNGGTLVKNNAYNGTSDLKFLAATGNNLAVGEEQYFFVTYNVKPNGNNGPIPGSVVATGTGNSTNVSDKSNRGTEVNQPVDNTTPVRFDLPSTLIGLSKSVGTPVSKGSGQFEIPYTIAVTNLGTNDLKGVQVIDDLGKTFGAQASVVGKPKVVVESGFAADTNYTGQGLLTNLLVDTLSTLPKGATRKIDLTVTIMLNNPDATTSFNNIAIGKGMTNGGAMTSDTSTTGANADPDFDLDPRNNSEPTGVTLNSSPGNGLIGVALSIKDTVRNGDGSINIKYRVIVKNFGAGLLTNVQVSDSLTRVFNRQTGASFQVVGTPTADDASTLRINPDFDGDRDVNLLIAEQSQLAAGKLDSLFFTVNVTTDGRQTPYLNRVAALANAGQVAVNDLSTDGVQPDLNGNNDPTEATEAEFTAIIIPGDGGLFVPEGFSPNGDGINDKFVIRHPSGTKVVVEIYNRWMNLVYRHNDYQNDWEGQANVGVAVNNQGLPAGTYFYNVILSDENGGEIKRVARFMTINR